MGYVPYDMFYQLNRYISIYIRVLFVIDEVARLDWSFFANFGLYRPRESVLVCNSYTYSCIM